MTTHAMSRLAMPVTERDHIRGSLDAPVTLVEYGDYECPHCGQAYYVLKAIEEREGHSLCIAFRNFPLTTVHPHAQMAAEAAEAAGGQGKFWPMHDMLFENQQALEEQYLQAYAEMLGLNIPRFIRALIEHPYTPRVREDVLSGARSGVNGTPAFFINNLRYDGPYDFRSLALAIEETREAA